MKISSILFDNSGQLVKNSDIKSYFDIYGFDENQLDIDESVLSNNYLELSKQVHPDLFNSFNDKQKELSIFYSELVNNGYSIIKNPFKRAKYFLEIKNEYKESKEIPSEVLDHIFEIQDLLDKDSWTKTEQIELDKYITLFTKTKQDYQKELLELFSKSKLIDINELYKKLNTLISANAYVDRIITNIEKRMELLDSE